MSGRCPTALNSLKTQKYKKKGNSEDPETGENKLEKEIVSQLTLGEMS